MITITIDRGEVCAIPFTITDTANGLLNMRVTWSVATAANRARVLRKVGGLPGSSADITITNQTAGQIDGTINLVAADFDTLTANRYMASLWIDDGAGLDQCVTAGGADELVIAGTVARGA